MPRTVRDDRQAPVLHAFVRLARVLRHSMSESLRKEAWVLAAGFRPPCLAVLECISRRGPLSQREIAEDVGVYPSDLVAALDILEEGRFVRRRRDPDDRRRNAVSLTGKGVVAARRLDALRAEVTEHVLQGLDAGERAELARLAEKALVAHRIASTDVH